MEYESGKLTCSESLRSTSIGPNDIHLAVSNPDRRENSYRLYAVDHVRNFLDCVKSRRDPIEPVETGHRTATICHLGNIAMQLKRKISWDPATEQIIGDDEASARLGRPLRAPWHL